MLVINLIMFNPRRMLMPVDPSSQSSLDASRDWEDITWAGGTSFYSSIHQRCIICLRGKKKMATIWKCTFLCNQTTSIAVHKATCHGPWRWGENVTSYTEFSEKRGEKFRVGRIYQNSLVSPLKKNMLLANPFCRAVLTLLIKKNEKNVIQE